MSSPVADLLATRREARPSRSIRVAFRFGSSAAGRQPRRALVMHKLGTIPDEQVLLPLLSGDDPSS